MAIVFVSFLFGWLLYIQVTIDAERLLFCVEFMQ